MDNTTKHGNSNDKHEKAPASWGVTTPGKTITQNDFPTGRGSVHVESPRGGYTLSVNGFDYDGFPRVSRWHDDD